jgi:hypothetical protein
VEVRQTCGYERLHERTHGPEPVATRIVWSLGELRNLTSDGVGSLDLARPMRWLFITLYARWQRVDQSVELRLGEPIDAKATREEAGPIERAL